MLDFSKIEAGMLELDEDEVDLRLLLSGAAELLCQRAYDKGVEISTVVAPQVPHLIRADEGRLRQVITNLMGNAVKFTEHGGVCVEAALVDGRLRIEVRDTGVGVAPSKRRAIFDEFVQADSSHARKFGGTGLGLAISKRLVDSMGGEIGVDARVHGGSCFWFSLPLIPAAATHDDAPLQEMQVAVISRNTALREGLQLQIAASGGLVVEKEEEADVVLIDAGTAHRPQLAAAPVRASLVLLAPHARGALAEMRAKGFAGYLVKPVRQSTLVMQLLHCRDGVEPPIAEGLQDAEPPAARKLTGTGLNILLAEDNPINMLLIRELLRLRGHKITEVTTGDAAVKAMAQGGYDLLLTDIHMPGMDGIEAARAIRTAEAESGRRRTPIVALTADAVEAGKHACLDAGMDGFLTKPVNPAELEEMLRVLFPAQQASHIVAA